MRKGNLREKRGYLCNLGLGNSIQFCVQGCERVVVHVILKFSFKIVKNSTSGSLDVGLL